MKHVFTVSLRFLKNMMMMSTVIAHASINLNVQCAETGEIHDDLKNF